MKKLLFSFTRPLLINISLALLRLNSIVINFKTQVNFFKPITKIFINFDLISIKDRLTCQKNTQEEDLKAPL